jgi:hypothetical protein
MAKEKSYEMNENIAKRVKPYLILYIIIILVLIWGDELYKTVMQSITITKESFDLSKEFTLTIWMIVVTIAMMLMNFGRDIQFHGFIDNKIFKVRMKTGKIIEENMIKAGKSVGARCANQMVGNWKETQNIFYHFVNDQTVLRDLSFTYWEQYFINIYVVFFGVISLIGSIVYLLVRHKFDFMIFIPTIILIIVIAFLLSTKFSLVKKIYALPEQQIEEIKVTKGEELKNEIEKRFKSCILYNGDNING